MRTRLRRLGKWTCFVYSYPGPGLGNRESLHNTARLPGRSWRPRLTTNGIADGLTLDARVSGLRKESWRVRAGQSKSETREWRLPDWRDDEADRRRGREREESRADARAESRIANASKPKIACKLGVVAVLIARQSRHRSVQRNMSNTTSQDEAHMTTPELIEAHGYVAETYQICTEDGYYLTVHRVLSPNDRVPSVPLNVETIINADATVDNKSSEDHNSSVSPNYQRILETLGCYTSPGSRLPVIINHGLLSSSADWVLLGPHKALAYVLCDNGFDVWLTNARGNTYSKSHKYYSIKDREFWNFSWHEIGYYDLPATIDYILEKTGHSKLYYIGHSQGAAAFYVMGSERPEYNAKVKGMISLAPAVFLGNQRSPLLKFIVHFYSIIDWGSYICNIHEWLPRNKLQSRVLRTFVCNAPLTLTKGFCNCWFFLVAGFGSDQLDKSMLPLIFGHSPAGASVKQLLHFSQLITSGSFRKFDYGTKTNLALYGSTQPSKYTLERVKVPVAIFYSENDFITHRTDVQKLVDNLPNVIHTEEIAYEKFNHIDYLWGRDAKTILYNRIATMLKKF